MNNRSLWRPEASSTVRTLAIAAFACFLPAVLFGLWYLKSTPASSEPDYSNLEPRVPIDTSGYQAVAATVDAWSPNASLQEISRHWDSQAVRVIDYVDGELAKSPARLDLRISLLTVKASCLMYDGEAEEAYAILREARELLESRGGVVRDKFLSTLIYFQGVAGLRLGENQNCIMCRGESSCILPIRPAAVHQDPEGSQLAIEHFTEYLDVFPNDVEVRWLLNLAHMTLGQYPRGVDPRYLVPLEKFRNSEIDIGRFRDVGHLVGVNSFGQAGGAIMEDFDNDGLLDLLITSFDCTQPVLVHRNIGNGRFEQIAGPAGIENQLGGLNCVQTDYNNDGLVDVYITRGAWLDNPIRPTLLRNEGQGRFTDVTADAGLLDPVNSIAAKWADFDNDGWLDLFVCCERQTNRLYRNLGNGKFEDVSLLAGVAGSPAVAAKGCAWIDYDNDDYPDLFVNNVQGAELFRNNRDGTFADVTRQLGVDGPRAGFSCWTWDYDNDGWLDIFATSYHRSMKGAVRGLLGEPYDGPTSRLFRNHEGQGFQDVTREAGLDGVYLTMGSNFADFDNDGFLDVYLGTGEPSFATLLPNRMFKNVGGTRFAEITGSAGVGHLQKGHGVACGDWDRDGNVDLFVQLGGAVDGDKFHDVLFQSPGSSNSWITLKLVGLQTNRAALGARIRIVTAGENPMTIHRHISSGSSFGGNPLQQTVGLARAKRIDRLEIHWPTSGTTQTFRNVDVNQALHITEFADDYEVLPWEAIPLPGEPDDFR